MRVHEPPILDIIFVKHTENLSVVTNDTHESPCRWLFLNQLGIRCIFFLSEMRLEEEEEEYKDYSRIIPACFDKSFLLM